MAWRSQRTPAITSRCSGVRDRRSGRREDGAGVRQQGSRRDPRAAPLRARSQDHECAPERATSSDAEACSDRDSSLRPQCYARPHSCRACGGGDRHANSRRARRASRPYVRSLARAHADGFGVRCACWSCRAPTPVVISYWHYSIRARLLPHNPSGWLAQACVNRQDETRHRLIERSGPRLRIRPVVPGRHVGRTAPDARTWMGGRRRLDAGLDFKWNNQVW